MPRYPAPLEVPPVEQLQQVYEDSPGSGPGAQLPDSFLREFHESRRIVEDIQRGTIEHVYVTKGHPNEAYLDSALAGLAIGNPHPWWSSPDASLKDVGKDMYLIRREFSKVTDRLAKDDRWTKITLLFQRRRCPFSYEEEYQMGSITLPTWWLGSPDNADIPEMFPIALGEGTPIPYAQILLRRHWPHVLMDYGQVRRLRRNQNTTNGTPFAGEEAGFWLLESINAKQLYGTSATDDTGLLSDVEHWDITITFRGDPYRHHEIWFADFGGGAVPVRPQSMKREHLAAVHRRFTIYKPGSKEEDSGFEKLIPSSAICKPLLST